MEKIGSKTFSKSCLKLAKTAPFIELQKLAVGVNPKPDDLSVDRPTVIFMTVGVAGRPPDRPQPDLDLSVDWSVDQGKNQRAKLFGRSIARSTGARSRE